MKGRIRQIRKHFHLTAQEFADKVGLSRGFVSQVETGRSGLSDEKIKNICTVFHIRAEWLQYGVDPMESDNLEDWVPKEKEKEQFEPVAGRVKELRDKLDLSQRAFAEKMGFSRELIGLVEQKRNPASRKLIIKIEETYNVNHDWLVNGNGDMFQPTAQSTSQPAQESAASAASAASGAHGADGTCCGLPMRGKETFKCLEYIFPSITDQHRLGYLIINRIPCKKCDTCGREMFSFSTEEKLEQMVKDLFPVFSLNTGFESPKYPGLNVGDTIIQTFVGSP